MKKRLRKYRFFALAAFSLTAIAALYGYREYNRTLPNTRDLKPAFQLEASDFVKKFENDESKANATYVDQTISVHGPAHIIQITDTTATVFLNDGYSGASVMCQFDNESIEALEKLKKGDQVIVKGICSGYLMDVVMVRCVLEKENLK